MSGFGTNPAGSSAFSFPSLKQPTATTASTMPTGYTFGAPNTTVTASPLGSTPTFGGTPPLGMKTGMTMTATSTPGTLPTLGAPQTGSLFGASSWSGVFSGGNPANTTSTASPLTSAAPAAASAPKTSQFTFGASVAPATAAVPVETSAASPFTIPFTSAPAKPPPTLQPAATSTPTLNFSFGSSPAPNTTAAAAAPAPAPAPSMGLNLPTFGSTPTSKPPTSQPAAAVASTALATPASTTLNFSVSSSTPIAAGAKPTTLAPNLSMFSTPTTSTPATTSIVPPVVSSAAPTATAAPVIAPSTTAAAPSAVTPAAATAAATAATSEEDVMTYSKLQEYINKWAMELEKQEKIFLHQATEMNGWDRVIVENSDKLHMLNAKIEKVRKEQRHLDLELDYILSQQNELDYILKGLEKEWGSVPPSDPERQHTYKIAESLDYKLKLMSEDLKEVVDHMNAMNYPPNDEFNPVMQIVRILNAHMNVLLMVERKNNLADSKVKEVGKLLELCKRDYDRACHLYFD